MTKLEFNFNGAKKEVGLFTKFTQLQVDCINAILCQCCNNSLTREQTAYVFATAYHEAYNPSVPNSRITPIKEFGGESYLKSKKYYPYFGRGFVQLTWKENYRKQGLRIGKDLVAYPDLVLDMNVASDILVWGMKHGEFTGRKLSDYIDSGKKDYVQARRIINGMDKANQIAGYARRFEAIITVK